MQYQRAHDAVGAARTRLVLGGPQLSKHNSRTAAGSHLTARGEVLRPGRTLTVCLGDAYGLFNGSPKHVATLLTTMASVSDTP